MHCSRHALHLQPNASFGVGLPIFFNVFSGFCLFLQVPFFSTYFPSYSLLLCDLAPMP